MEITSRPLETENPNPSPINSPKPISRSETNPTTFIQADTNSFKQVVQMLTGSSETIKQASKPKPNSDPPNSTKTHNIPPIRAQKRQGFKLYERRNQIKNGFMISPLIPRFSNNSGGSPETLSPSVLDFPSLVLSPVTPLIEDPFDKSSEEEKGIAEKGFYLHPSPRTVAGDSEPRLLPLFPVTSPRVSGSSI